jgi:hypothetical protein
MDEGRELDVCDRWAEQVERESCSRRVVRGVQGCDQCRPGANKFALQGASYEGALLACVG